MSLTPDEQRLLARVLHGFDTDDGEHARLVLQDCLLERDHPWGHAMVTGKATHRRAIERSIYGRIHRVVTRKDRRWTHGFLTGARIRAKHLDELRAADEDPLWRVMERLTLAPNQGERIPHVARFVGRTPWARLTHLGLDDPRFVAPMVEAGFPDTLTSVYLWALGGVDAATIADALPESVSDLHVQVFQQLGADDVGPLFQRTWDRVRVEIAQPWIRELAVGQVTHLDLETASFSLSGTAHSTGFHWTIRRHFPDVEQHLWRFVQRWPAEERDLLCPERPVRNDEAYWR